MIRRLALATALAVLGTYAAIPTPAVAAKTKKCKAIDGEATAVAVAGIRARKMGCAAAREFSLAYSLTPKPNRKELAAAMGVGCKSRPGNPAVPGSFKVTCKGKGRSERLVRFKYRPA
jgi:hypothetical protein